MPQPHQLATWNSDRDFWETGEDIFGHSDVYSETWPTSGMTRNGVAFELPTWEHRTAGSGSSSSPQDETLLLTPVASEGIKPSNTMGVSRRLETGQVFLTNQIVSLCGLDPTERLLPTPTAMDSKAGGGGYNGQTNVTHWGSYEPAVRRWEAVRGAAPAPTEPNANGKHRLSAAFCEWMMGLEPGWVTSVPGISRNEQLKALGNGVVPQQATAALRDMLTAKEPVDD